MKKVAFHATILAAAIVLSVESFCHQHGAAKITTTTLPARVQQLYAASSSGDKKEPAAGTATAGTSVAAPAPAPAPPTTIDSTTKIVDGGNQQLLLAELKEVASCLGIVVASLLPSSSSSDDTKTSSTIVAEELIQLCDDLDALQQQSQDLFVSRVLHLRRRAMEFQRYELLVKLLREDYDAYIATASFLSPSRIPRLSLPNLQDVPYHHHDDEKFTPTPPTTIKDDDKTQQLVADCELEDLKFHDSPLDKLLLRIFRNLVEQNTNGIRSDKPGIEGLLEQGRAYYYLQAASPEAQHKMVRDTLGGLMTPVLPPFYRIFMSGIVPFRLLLLLNNNNNNNTDNHHHDNDGKQQLGPWFYAPFLTSIVTPTFFAFLVGPSYPNRRKDGQRGGLVVEKCKFLQESNCKGLCLHQCKLPAQQFFKEELGLPLTVTPNFVTQECQWSFGEMPLPPSEDPDFPNGCLVGCLSRKTIAAAADTPATPAGGSEGTATRMATDICNY